MGLGEQSLKQPPMKRGSPDDFQTPVEALWPLLPYLRKDWTVWECAAGNGNLVAELMNNGYDVVASDVKDGKNFLQWRPARFDCVVTNPPYSLKQEFLERCYQLGKPFALLLPLTTFETRKRQALFVKHGLQVVFFDRRINFETPGPGKGEGGAWFATAWFTWGLQLGRDMTFVRYAHRDQKCLGDWE